MALVCALLLRKRNVKKRKKFCLHPITSQKLLKGKFYSLYEELKAHPKRFFLFRYFKMSSATVDKLLVLLGPSLTFQDIWMRKPVPPEESPATRRKPCHQKKALPPEESPATRRNLCHQKKALKPEESPETRRKPCHQKKALPPEESSATRRKPCHQKKALPPEESPCHQKKG